MRLSRPAANATNIAWFVLYLASMGALVYWLAEARGWAMERLSTPEAQSQWQAWQREVERSEKQPAVVARRVPPSKEPPTLVLLRDSFPGVLVTCLAAGTFLFCFIMVVARGAFRQSSGPVDVRFPAPLLHSTGSRRS